MGGGYGGIAQLARAFGSYPKCHRFESSYRYHSLEPHREVRLDLSGLFVKWLRHRPFTAGSRVRIPYRSPKGTGPFGVPFLFSQKAGFEQAGREPRRNGEGKRQKTCQGHVFSAAGRIPYRSPKIPSRLAVAGFFHRGLYPLCGGGFLRFALKTACSPP